MKEIKVGNALVSFAGARALDKESSEQWGLHPFALVEAAGRACAEVFSRAFLSNYQLPTTNYPLLIVLAGTGNNAADALVMLRTLVLEGRVPPAACTVFTASGLNYQLPTTNNPLHSAITAVQMLHIPVAAWDEQKAAESLAVADFIIDGIAGTGLDSPLCDSPLPTAARPRPHSPLPFQMVEAVNALRHDRHRPVVVSVDIPSGVFDGWRPGMPAVAADATLAIEPQKLCLYTPTARPYAGKILSVGGIFPPALLGKYSEAELVSWKNASRRIPRIPETAYKYTRGLVEIRAGSPGAAGAAKLAAFGAQAAGAGLVRLIVDPSLYPVVAPACSGIMAVPDGIGIGDWGLGTGVIVPYQSENTTRDDLKQQPYSPIPDPRSPSSVLLGPGWGRGEDRKRLLETYLPLEEKGLPLILDADAIVLAKDIVFHGNAVLTPHPGEFAEYTGIPKDEILADPVPILRRIASEKKVHILFKSHVLYAVSPDGRFGIVDGMNPLLAAGGSGDVLAGFCASIAARTVVPILNPRSPIPSPQSPSLDGYACMCAAASLLIKASKSKEVSGRFVDPEAIARAAAVIAGKAWLPII
jgi:NAD(P)H-hydrate epimerase